MGESIFSGGKILLPLQYLDTRAILALTASLLLALMLAACGSGSNGMSVRSQSLEQIVGGQDAVGTEAFASTVASLGDKFGPFCTVSLISENIALTAAHCLSEQPKNLVLFFGIEPTISGPSGRTFRQVDSYEVSPFWKAKTAQEIDFGDIAVIHFSGGLPEGYKTVPMIKDIGLLSVGQETLLAGFGDNDGVARSGGGKLRFVKTTILDPAYGKSELTVDQSKGKGACYGDSGGPAYVEIEGKLHVAGVTSRGEEECLIATIYTSTAAHVDWISEASQRLTLKHAAPTLAPIALGN